MGCPVETFEGVLSSTTTWGRAWRRASSPRHAKIWRPLRRNPSCPEASTFLVFLRGFPLEIKTVVFLAFEVIGRVYATAFVVGKSKDYEEVGIETAEGEGEEEGANRWLGWFARCGHVFQESCCFAFVVVFVCLVCVCVLWLPTCVFAGY